MDALTATFQEQLSGAATGLFLGYLSLLLSWPLFLLLEKLTPARPGVPRENYRFNWLVTFSNAILAPTFAALVAMFTLAVSGFVGLPSLELTSDGIGVGIPSLDFLLQVMVIFLVACFLGDFSYYWWHRAQHTFPFLWELHKLHHSDENLNTTTIFRSHFLEPAGQGLFRGLSIGLIFDTTPQATLAAGIGMLMLGLWDYFIHANVRIDRLYRLTPFFSNPQFHWIHHSRLPQHQDKNFAIWLPMFDVAFGSYYKPQVDEYPPTGLSSGEKIETLWDAQAGPLIAWGRGIRAALARRAQPAAKEELSQPVKSSP
ncbi:MAG: sterol desaturase family protein [Halioglobus sp.]|nr:sterol desaturase family protein [Halioglobus sp.]